MLWHVVQAPEECHEGALWQDVQAADVGCVAAHDPYFWWQDSHDTESLCLAGAEWHVTQVSPALCWYRASAKGVVRP